jgi:hypothetical protein
MLHSPPNGDYSMALPVIPQRFGENGEEILAQTGMPSEPFYQEGDPALQQEPLPPSKGEIEQMEKDIVDYIFELDQKYTNSEYRQGKITDSDINRRHYAQKTDPGLKDWPWKNASCVTLPLTAIAVDNIEPRMVAAIEGKGEEICRFQDVGEENPELVDIQCWFNQELLYKIEIRKKCRGIVHDALLDGTVFIIPAYEHREEIRRDFKYVMAPVMVQAINPINGEPVALPVNEAGMVVADGEQPKMVESDEIEIGPDGEMVTEDYIDVLFDGGSVEILDLKDVKCPDKAEEWEEADILRDVLIPYGDLRRWQEEGIVGYQHIDDDLFREVVTEVVVDGENKNGGSQAIHGRKVVPCVEALIKWDFQPKADRDAGKYVGYQKIVCLVTKTSQKLIRMCLQRDINFQGKKHIRRLRLNPEYGWSLGTAPATKLREIQIGASDTFNLVLNSSFVCMIPWFFYGPGSGLDKGIELVPGQGVECADPSQVKFLTFNADPARFVEFINIFFSLWERLSSVSDVQVGRAPEIQGNKAQTATGTMMQVQEANVKHSYTSKQFQEEFSELLDMIYDLYYMHAPMQLIFESEGEQKKLSKSVMRKRRKFVLTGTTETSNKYVDRMEAESLYNLAKGDPIANRVKCFEELLKSYDKDNPEGYIDPNVNQILEVYEADPQSFMQALQQYVMAMQQAAEIAQQAQKGGGAGGAAKSSGAAA